ncbi:carbonic anhydrase [Kitasatospora sp. NPDC101176]|uniref:carbonic anhydrase n=1 Tax=Kitasatospora sp. NPDC101176 TaxID=3364099 RepID=UPI00381004C8
MQSLVTHARVFPHRLASGGHDLGRLSAGQAPEALFITCSDSRVVPALITGSRPGQLFELRTAGNIVPVYDTAAPSGEAATIEYAVDILRVPDVIVCGHSHCGSIGALVRAEDLAPVPAVRTWLEHAAPPTSHLAPVPAHDQDADVARPVQRSVLAQLDRLRSYPGVARRLAEGSLRLHGWYYEVHTGTVLAGSDRGFLPL